MRKHKAEGGEADFGKPRDDAKADLADKPPVYAGREGKVDNEAEEKKHGGKARRKRKSGGVAKHHESDEPMKHAKHLGPVSGKAHAHGGRAARQSGGRAGSNFSPFSSARAGTPPRGHKVTEID